MAQKDFIVKGSKIEYEGLFCFDDLYKHIKTWFTRRGYGMRESEYKEVKADTRNIKISVDAIKEVSDYISFLVELSIKLENLKEVKKKLSQLNIMIGMPIPIKQIEKGKG